jgi:uncharacterized protein YkwD
MLWLLNYARTNPKGAADLVTSNPDANLKATFNFYGIDANAVRNDIASAAARPPLSWNDTLAQAAIGQSQYQADNGVQSHTGANGSNLDQRLDQAGYTDRVTSGENAYAYSQSVDHAMEAFLIDWGVPGHGHRNNILQPDASPDQYFHEVGIGIVDSNKPNFGPEVITQDFGTQADTPAYLLGVAYNDPNHTHMYIDGTGQGDVEIDATNEATGETKSTTTWGAGGYQIPLTPSNYDVTAKVNGQIVRIDRGVNIGSQNVEIDYDLSDPWQGGGSTSNPGSGSQSSSTSSSAPVLQTQFLGLASKASNTNTASATQPQSQAQATGQISSASNSAPLKTSAPSFGNWSMWTARRS